MPTFETSSGPVSVENWGYQLQGRKGRLKPKDFIDTPHDLLVIEASRDGSDAGRFTADDIARIQNASGERTVVAAYISIGEAEEYRDYWQTDWTTTGTARGRLTDAAPGWLGPLNPNWPESRKVRYWDEDWQDIVFNDAGTGRLDAIVASGADAAYLDIVDAYYFWGAEATARQREAGDPKNEKQAAKRMVDFIVEMTEHARETNPDFFVIPQSAPWIVDALGKDQARRGAFLDAIGAVAVEDLYFRGNKDENNRLNPDEETIEILKRDYLDNGIPVFVVDYLNNRKKVETFYELAREDGFIPYAAPSRELDRLGTPHDMAALAQVLQAAAEDVMIF